MDYFCTRLRLCAALTILVPVGVVTVTLSPILMTVQTVSLRTLNLPTVSSVTLSPISRGRFGSSSSLTSASAFLVAPAVLVRLDSNKRVSNVVWDICNLTSSSISSRSDMYSNVCAFFFRWSILFSLRLFSTLLYPTLPLPRVVRKLLVSFWAE